MQKIIFNASKNNHQAQVPLPLSQQNPKSKLYSKKNKLTILAKNKFIILPKNKIKIDGKKLEYQEKYTCKLLQKISLHNWQKISCKVRA